MSNTIEEQPQELLRTVQRAVDEANELTKLTGNSDIESASDLLREAAHHIWMAEVEEEDQA